MWTVSLALVFHGAIVALSQPISPKEPGVIVLQLIPSGESPQGDLAAWPSSSEVNFALQYEPSYSLSLGKGDLQSSSNEAVHARIRRQTAAEGEREGRFFFFGRANRNSRRRRQRFNSFRRQSSTGGGGFNRPSSSNRGDLSHYRSGHKYYNYYKTSASKTMGDACCNGEND